MSTQTKIPKTMKAIQVHEFVEDFSKLNKTMTMTDQAPVPDLQKDQMLVKVQACSISPGDIIMCKGNLIFLHQPFPFIPGMDICGTVVDANGSSKFKNGDVIVSSNGISPVGGMAEFMAVNTSHAVVKPTDVDVLKAAASSSAMTALTVVRDYVKAGDRVLILGGSGGVGSAAIAMAKQHSQASFVATTSTQQELCSDILGADQVINYREENWWEMEQFHKEPFDIVIDTVGGGNFYGKVESGTLKPRSLGGRFVAVAGDDKSPDCTTVWKAVKYLFKTVLPWRSVKTWFHSSKLPSYTMIMPSGDAAKLRQQVLQLMEDGTLLIQLDGPALPFTEAGVQKAFATVASGHAHGKIVVSIE